MIKKSKIFLVDDHALVREGLTRLIDQQPHLTVCGEAEDGAEAVEKLQTEPVDLIIVDLFLKKNFSGLELIKDLKGRHPQLKIIVVSMYEESIYGLRSLRAGAQGYVMKKESSSKIIDAIDKVLAGGTYMSDELATSMVMQLQGSIKGEGESLNAALSDREMEVFELLGNGRTTLQISESMTLSLKTVHSYCARIKEKLNLTNYNELLRESVKHVEKK